MSKTWYFADQKQGRPVEVTGEGYPGRDSLNNEMFINSHFKTEDEAWAKLFSESKAGFSIAVMAVEEAERKLAERKEVLVKKAKERYQIETTYEEWLATQEEGSR